MKNPAKIRLPTKHGGVLTDESNGAQKADPQMEVDPTGELEKVSQAPAPTVVQTEAYYTQQGGAFGKAQVAGDTGNVVVTLGVFIDGTEYHFGVKHKPQQVAHPINHQMVPDAVGALEKLWTILETQAPLAVKGKSLADFKAQVVFIGQMQQVEDRATALASGVEDRRAVAENALVSTLREVYDAGESTIHGNTVWQRLAEPLFNLFFQNAVDAAQSRKDNLKVAGDATAKALGEQPPGNPGGTTPAGTGSTGTGSTGTGSTGTGSAGTGSQGIVGIPVTGSAVPPPAHKPSPPTTGRSAPRGGTRKKKT